MKKIKYIPVFFVAAVLCLLLINSCNDKENPVTLPDSEYQFDSARYDWNFQYFPEEFLTFDAFDTSNIYILGSSALLKCDGNNFHYNYYDDPNFSPLSLGSYDKNNIYIGGDDISVINYGKPRLQKWNSAAFEEILIPNIESRKYQISAIQALNENEVWLGSTRGDIIHYNVGSFEFFRVDTTFIITMFGSDETGSFYSVASKTVYDSQTINYLNIYRKNSDSWEWSLIFSEKYVESQYLNEIRPSKINFNIIGFENNRIEKFTDLTFNEIFHIEPFTAYPMNKLSDSSINYFSLPGRIGSHGFELFNWNGSIWSKEVDFQEKEIYLDRFSKLENVEGKYFVLCSDVSTGICYFGKGLKKPIH